MSEEEEQYIDSKYEEEEKSPSDPSKPDNKDEEEVDEMVYNQNNALMEESIEQEFQCLNP